MEGGRLMMDGGWWKIEDFSVSEGETSSPEDPHRLSSAERKSVMGTSKLFQKLHRLATHKSIAPDLHILFRIVDDDI
jgi:hypothetical protein